MGNKREIDTRDSIRVVTSNNFLKACGLEKISLKARKLLYLAIAQCKQNDSEFFEYSIKVADFAKFMGIDASNVYDEADKITDELMQGFIKYMPKDKKKFEKFQLFSKCKYTQNAEITFIMSEDMTPLVLGLKKDFTQPLLQDFAKMRSNYSMMIWHLMQREMKSKKPYSDCIFEFDLTLEELRIATGTEEKFKKIIDFKRYVLDRAIREIKENCFVVVEYESIKKNKKIVSFHFKTKSIFYINQKDISLQTIETINRIEENRKKRNL